MSPCFQCGFYHLQCWLWSFGSGTCRFLGSQGRLGQDSDVFWEEGYLGNVRSQEVSCTQALRGKTKTEELEDMYGWVYQWSSRCIRSHLYPPDTLSAFLCSGHLFLAYWASTLGRAVLWGVHELLWMETIPQWDNSRQVRCILRSLWDRTLVVHCDKLLNDTLATGFLPFLPPHPLTIFFSLKHFGLISLSQSLTGMNTACDEWEWFRLYWKM